MLGFPRSLRFLRVIDQKPVDDGVRIRNDHPWTIRRIDRGGSASTEKDSPAAECSAAGLFIYRSSIRDYRPNQ
jgi:hypothetical protein